MFFKRVNSYLDYEKYHNGNLFLLSLEDDLIPQGICSICSYIFITCYTTSHNFSRVLIYDLEGKLFNTVVLDNKSHVGGIGYDSFHQLLFICDSHGTVSSYSFREFIQGNLKSKKSYLVADDSLGGSILKEEGRVVCSYLTCFQNKLYVGSFNKRENGLVKVFNIVRKREGICLEFIKEFSVPSKIQGIQFYQDVSNLYLLLSRSYTRVKDSEILLYQYLDDINHYITPFFSFSLPPMLEQITLYQSKNLLLLFESCAKKYRYNAKIVVDHVVSLDLQRVISDISS